MSTETNSTASPQTPRSGGLLPHWPISVPLLEDLSKFFELMGLSKATVESYVNGCTNQHIRNVNELREKASIQYLLEVVGISSEHAFHVMRKLFELDIESPIPFQTIPRRRPLLPPAADVGSPLTRTNLVILVSSSHSFLACCCRMTDSFLSLISHFVE